MRAKLMLAAALLAAIPIPALATVFATVHGIVHDPQHRPLPSASILLESTNSAFKIDTRTDANGAFEIAQTPIGIYQLRIEAPGFSSISQTIAIASGTNTVLHFQLEVGSSSQTVVVTSSAESSDTVHTHHPRLACRHRPNPRRQPHPRLSNDHRLRPPALT